MGPVGKYTDGDVAAVEENLKKKVLEQAECVNRPKKEMLVKFGHFGLVVKSSSSYDPEPTVSEHYFLVSIYYSQIHNWLASIYK